MTRTSEQVVVVTGGAGYVGSHACKALAQRKFLPVSVDNLINGHRWAVRWGPLEEGDITDPDFVLQTLKRYRPLAVMHFAAFAYVGESVRYPDKYYRNNVLGGLRLLEACQTTGVSRIVYSSTCATYGIPGKVPISEDQPQNPVNPYGTSKLLVERALSDFGHAYGFRSVSLRYFNAAGADPDGEVGEHHEPETHLIPLALDAAAALRPHVTVFGNDYPTIDGTCIRDFVHVTDLARAHVAALEHLLSGGASATLNLGAGAGHSVLQVLDATHRITGRKIPYEIGPRRPGDPPTLIADATRARQLLKWQPQYSDLETIIATAWAWHQKRRSGRRNEALVR